MKILKCKCLFVQGMCLGFLLFVHPSWSQSLTPQAQQIFETYHPSIIQVRVISKGSGEKSSLGSGFFFTENGLIASNYHVIADAVNFPEFYYVEYILHDGQRGNLEVLNVDPVHDVAVLKADIDIKQHLPLGHFTLNKGDKIFSFGNPYDMGMIIIEGLFNGLLERARYSKILFSGSLNPGMSGGPAINADGYVIGVNVSTAGDDISFFVPVEYLRVLYDEVVSNEGKSVGYNWRAVIRKRLIMDQQEFIGQMLKPEPWGKRRIGMAQVPGEITQEFKCWGKTEDNIRFWIADTYLTCSTEDDIFISDTMRTGVIYVDYEWYESRGKNPARFYNLFEQYAGNRNFEFRAGERDVGNFKCDRSFLNIQGRTCRVEFCARPYKMYSGLFDISVQVTTADTLNKGLVINLYALGFTDIQAKSFLRRFLKEIQWIE